MTSTPDTRRVDVSPSTKTLMAEIEASVGDPDDPRRVWIDGEDCPDPGDQEVESVDIRLAAGLATPWWTQGREHRDPNENAVRVFQREDRTILLCLDGHGGEFAAQAAADHLDHELGTSNAPIEDADHLIDVLLGVNDAVRRECTRFGRPGSRTAVALAIVEDGLVRWVSLGDALIALVHPDGSIQRLGTPRQRFLGRPMDRAELAAAVDTGVARLWCGAWLVPASDGVADSTPDWRRTLQKAAIVRTHYPVDDLRRAWGIPTAATVVRQLMDACGGLRSIAAVVLRRPDFVDLPDEQRAIELAAWEDPTYQAGRWFPMGPGHGYGPHGHVHDALLADADEAIAWSSASRSHS